MTPRARAAAWSAAAVALAVAAAATLGWWALAGRDSGVSAGRTLEQVRAAATEPSASPSPADAGPDRVPGAPPTGPSAVPPGAAPAVATQAAPVPPAPAPERLVVASLGIDAAVDAVGVEPDGSMTIPRSGSRVGWYRFGSAPGDPAGNTVLAGHVDSRAEGPGAMFRLREVEVGERIEVTDAAGAVRAYEVAGIETIVKTTLPVDTIFARDGSPLLVLVTCGGPFQPELRSYRDNVVVTAVPVAPGA